MGRIIPFELARPSGIFTVLDDGYYAFDIESCEEQTARSGNYMMVVGFRGAEPASAAGTLHTENYVVGTPEDPGAADPDTWAKSVGFSRFARLMDRAKVARNGAEAEQVCQEAIGKRVILQVQQEVEPAIDKYGQPNQYAGRVRMRVRESFAVGERPLGPLSAIPGTALKAAPVGTAAPKAKPPAVLACTVCKASVAVKDYGAHMLTH